MQLSVVTEEAAKARISAFFALCVPLVAVGLFTLQSHLSDKFQQRATDKLTQVSTIVGRIELLDERLSLSTKMAIESGDQQWVDRYHQFVSQMDLAIQQATAVSPTAIAEKFTLSTRRANDALVAYEMAAFDAIARGDLDTARQLVYGESYRTEKRVLSNGINALIEATINHFELAVEQSRRNAQRWMMALVVVCLAVALMVWRWIGTSIATAESRLLSAQKEIQEVAWRDALTGLPNRTALKDEARRALSRAGRQGNKVCMLVIDLDKFKSINDRHGHLAGDAVLQEAGRRLSECFREEEVIGRYGGDEFVALLEHSADTDPIESINKRLFSQFESPIIFESRQFIIGATVGYAQYPDDASTYEELFRCADVALYEAKQTRPNRAIRFKAELDEVSRAQAAIEEELREAFDRGELFPHYQPLIDLHTGQVRTLEVLARWRHPEKGMVPPDQFIPVAESAGLLQAVTEAVLGAACREVRALNSNISVAINLSPEQFLDESTPGLISNLLASHRFPCERLEVELTENALVGDLNSAQLALERFRDLGISVALDDFGTGYSSLAYLSALHFDKIKIDRSFVMTMHERRKSRTIVNAIIGLGASLDIPTVAEGVESSHDVDALTAMGCRFAQGFHYSKPVSIGGIVQFLDERKAATEQTTGGVPEIRQVGT